MLRVFIGYDDRQPISYQVLAHSIVTRSTLPVSITPLILDQMPVKRRGLTPFTFSRFLVPYLCGYEGRALFLDADMLCLGDIADLFKVADPFADVSVIRNPKLRFEWASLMLFDNARCGRLTPEYVEKAEGMHKIAWADKVGDLPSAWNHCVGYDAPRTDAKLVHYTQGIPHWFETKDCEYAEEWRAEHRQCNHALPWADLMVTSVHAQPVLERMMAGYKDAFTRQRQPQAAD